MRLGRDGTFGWTTLVNLKIAIRIGRSVRVQYDMYRKRLGPQSERPQHHRPTTPCIGNGYILNISAPPRHRIPDMRRDETRQHGTGPRTNELPTAPLPSLRSPVRSIPIAYCNVPPLHHSHPPIPFPPPPPSHPAPPPRRATPSHPTTLSSPSHRPDVPQAELTRHAHTHSHIHTYIPTYIHILRSYACLLPSSRA